MAFASQLDLTRVQILDGGMGSLIEYLGYDCSSTDAWGSGANLTHPECVVQAHKEFINAGADILLTNTYQANIKRLSKSLGKEEALQCVENGVNLAKQAADGHQVSIFGSIGPFATYFCDGSEYTGAYMNDPTFNKNLVRHYYEQQVRALHNTGIRFFTFETVPTLAEAIYARDVLEEIACDGIIAAVCKDEFHLANGDRFSDFVKELSESPRVKAIGINCTSPEYVKSLLQVGAPHLRDKAFVVYPNSGEKYDGLSKEFYGNVRIARIIEELDDWIKLGVKVIGGCCRVKPEDIRLIANHVNKIA
ncbi:Homocysteine S-methyltransferase 1 [Aphelenchoides bicaudatus]|nr:Homocysteine S-methyltransferase 1 [Aphelenchoides bicaudatus]